MHHIYALLDDEGNVVRTFDYHATGAVLMLPEREVYTVDDPRWNEPLF